MTVATTEQSHATAVVVTGSVGGNLIREAAAVMSDAHLLAKAVCNTAMVPKHFQGKPDDTAAAMLYGASLGLDPMQAVRAVYVVHGQPGLAARSMDALVKGAGHETWTVSSTDEAVTVAGRRRGSDHIEESTWTIERATKAGYVPTIDPDTGKFRLNKWGKVDGNEKYLTDPQAMLHAKATAEVCRKIAPDVLSGVYAVEELQSERYEFEQVDRPRRGLAAALADPETSGAEDEVQGSSSPGSAPVAGASVAPSAPESPYLNTRGKLAKTMFALFGAINLKEKPDRLAYVSDVVGRTVNTSTEMTDADAEKVIAAIEADLEAAKQAAPPAPVAGPLCPACAQGKHVNCEGQAWDPEADEPVACACTDPSHDSAAE